MMMIVVARKEWFTGEHLGKDAPDRPYIDRLGILLKCKHNLRGAILSSGDVFGHEASFCS